MPDPARLRDSTQIIIPRETLAEVRDDLTDEFMVTIDDGEEYSRIIASPVVITEIGEFLTRRGIPIEGSRK